MSGPIIITLQCKYGCASLISIKVSFCPVMVNFHICLYSCLNLIVYVCVEDLFTQNATIVHCDTWYPRLIFLTQQMVKLLVRIMTTVANHIFLRVISVLCFLFHLFLFYLSPAHYIICILLGWVIFVVKGYGMKC